VTNFIRTGRMAWCIIALAFTLTMAVGWTPRDGAAGRPNEVTFNNSGSEAGDARFTFDPLTGVLTPSGGIVTPTVTSATGFYASDYFNLNGHGSMHFDSSANATFHAAIWGTSLGTSGAVTAASAVIAGPLTAGSMSISGVTTATAFNSNAYKDATGHGGLTLNPAGDVAVHNNFVLPALSAPPILSATPEGSMWWNGTTHLPKVWNATSWADTGSAPNFPSNGWVCEIDTNSVRIKKGATAGVARLELTTDGPPTYGRNGAGNVDFGSYAGNSTVGTNNTAFGYTAGVASSGDYNVAIGENAGSSANGSENTALGSGAGLVSPGSGNTAIGCEARAYVTGSNNVAVGKSALNSSSGSQSVAVGAGSAAGSPGSNNVAVGYCALEFAGGSNNIGIGQYSLAYSAGSRNTAIGDETLMFAPGSDNSELGAHSYVGTSRTINKITALGALAGDLLSTGASNVIALGYSAGATATTSTNEFFLGGWTGSVSWPVHLTWETNAVAASAVPVTINRANYLLPLQSTAGLSTTTSTQYSPSTTPGAPTTGCLVWCDKNAKSSLKAIFPGGTIVTIATNP
jgi:hypothetical protein